MRRMRFLATLALLLGLAGPGLRAQDCGCQPACGCDPCGSGCASGCCDDGLLCGLIKPSDHCLCDFISPMTNPVFFEDPRTLTEARFIFAHHTIPDRAPLAGGDVRVLAMQVRAALSDRLSIVAAKDGFIFASPEAPLDDGWADVAAGLKYNLLVDHCAQQVVSVGASYELPVGSRRALQGNGDGEFHLYLTGGQQIGSLSHLIAAAGWRLPADHNDESQSMYASLHLDRKLSCCSPFYVFVEGNWFHWLRSGENGVPGIEGGDYFNLGSTNVAGNDIVTGAFGMKYKPSCHTEIGVAWEFPLTDRRDLLDNRLTVDWIVRY